MRKKKFWNTFGYGRVVDKAYQRVANDKPGSIEEEKMFETSYSKSVLPKFYSVPTLFKLCRNGDTMT